MTATLVSLGCSKPLFPGLPRLKRSLSGLTLPLRKRQTRKRSRAIYGLLQNSVSRVASSTSMMRLHLAAQPLHNLGRSRLPPGPPTRHLHFTAPSSLTFDRITHSTLLIIIIILISRSIGTCFRVRHQRLDPRTSRSRTCSARQTFHRLSAHI